MPTYHNQQHMNDDDGGEQQQRHHIENTMDHDKIISYMNQRGVCSANSVDHNEDNKDVDSQSSSDEEETSPGEEENYSDVISDEELSKSDEWVLKKSKISVRDHTSAVLASAIRHNCSREAVKDIC